MTMLLADGSVATVSPHHRPELFWATVGGMGLTGVVLSATFSVIPIETSRMSVDTMRAEVAAASVDAGAVLVNDVSGGLADPEMARLVAATGVSYVLMHWRGHSHDMQKRAVYTDVVQEVHDELDRRMAAVVDQGVDPGQIIIDPGLGFSKSPDRAHNWALLAQSFINPFFGWVKNYIFRLGFLDGAEGLIFHLNHAVYAHWKYVKVWEARKKAQL